MFFEGSNGLFFLLALIRANDLTLHAEIQRHLDAVDHAGNPFSVGFQAILAMLHLLRGAEPKARALLDDLRKFAVHSNSPSGTLRRLVWFVDPELKLIEAVEHFLGYTFGNNQTPMAVWRASMDKIETAARAVDMPLRLDNANALPTYPQQKQKQQEAA